MICHAPDIFSIIFATSYVKVKNRRSQGRRIVCFGYVHAPEVRKSSKQKSTTINVIYLFSIEQINPLFIAIKSMAVLIRNHTQYR